MLLCYLFVNKLYFVYSILSLTIIKNIAKLSEDTLTPNKEHICQN